MKKIFLLILSLLLCGCGNYSELNKLSIVTAVALDKNDDKYELLKKVFLNRLIF